MTVGFAFWFLAVMVAWVYVHLEKRADRPEAERVRQEGGRW